MNKGKVESLTRRRLLGRLDALLAANPGMGDRLAHYLQAEQEQETMARAKKDPAKTLTGGALNLRITPEDRDRLDAVAELDRNAVLTRHAIALAALRIGLAVFEKVGLAALEKDPASLLADAASAKPKHGR